MRVGRRAWRLKLVLNDRTSEITGEKEVLQQKPGPEHMYDHRCEGFCVENMYNCTDRF